MKQIPTIFIESKDFHNAWVRSARAVAYQGRVMRRSEDSKLYKEAFLVVILSDNAINQIKNKELAYSFPTKKEHLMHYLEQFKRDFKHNFTYTYIDRFTKYPCLYNSRSRTEFDQIYHVKKALRQLQAGFASRRIQMITWIPCRDAFSDEPPCLQRIWISKTGIHLHWRSRDVFNAWQTNIIAIVDMLLSELEGTGFDLSYIIDITDSAHIYLSDLELAKKIKENTLPTL